MAAKADENIIDDPTYPKYKIGGWIAKAGSWSIGLRPIPSSGVGKIKLNGFDVWIKKRKNPIIIICWKIKVKSLYLSGWFLVLKSLEENVVYFQSPSEINSSVELNKSKIRVGGMVKKNSISINSNEINFIITDFKNEINVTFTGAVPNLFEEEKGVVAEGFLKDRNVLSATKILAKHDENYMPPEVKAALEDK